MRTDNDLRGLRVSILVMALAQACGGGGTKAAGSQGGPCYGNGSCNSGLTCLSHLCVQENGNDAAAGAGTGGATGGGGAAGSRAAGTAGAAAGTGGSAGGAAGAGAAGTDGGAAGADAGGAGGTATCLPASSNEVGYACTDNSQCCNNNCYGGFCCNVSDEDGQLCGATGPPPTGAGGAGGGGAGGGAGAAGASGAGGACGQLTTTSQGCTTCLDMHCCSAANACSTDPGCESCVLGGGGTECMASSATFAALATCASGLCTCGF